MMRVIINGNTKMFIVLSTPPHPHVWWEEDLESIASVIMPWGNTPDPGGGVDGNVLHLISISVYHLCQYLALQDEICISRYLLFLTTVHESTIISKLNTEFF